MGCTTTTSGYDFRKGQYAEAETHWGHARRGPNESYVRPPSVRERIGSHLDVYGARLAAPAAFLQPRRVVAVGAPQPRPFQPAFGSSTRPSKPLAKKPSGY